MRARSKALRHPLERWDCERRADVVDGRLSESLVVEFETCGASIRLRLWDDGVFWFSIRDMQAQLVAFELSFHGELQEDRIPELRRTLRVRLGVRYNGDVKPVRFRTVWVYENGQWSTTRTGVRGPWIST